MPSIDALRAAAAEQAARLQSEFIGTEHLFLAWLTWARGPIADAVSAAGLNADSFQEVLAKGSKRGRGRRGGPAPGESGSLTSHAQRVLETALERAKAAGREEPGTDDLILAMVQEPRGAIARALTEFDIKPSRLKALASDRPVRGGRPSAAQQPSAEVPEAPRQQKERPSRREQGDAKPSRGTASQGRATSPATPVPPPAPEPTPEAADPQPHRIPRKPSLDLNSGRRFGLLAPLYLAVPAALVLQLTGSSPLWVCLAAALGAIPMAGLLGEATEQLMARSSALGAALLAAFLGNGAVLAMSIAALRHGHPRLAVASLAGSLIVTATLLPGLGLVGSVLKGGPRGRTTTGSSALLLVAVMLSLIPTLAQYTMEGGPLGRGLLLPQTFALLLVATLVFALGLSWRSRQPIFGGMQWPEGAPSGAWSTRTATGLALIGLAGVVGMADLALRTLDAAGVTAMVSPAFLGLVVLPLLGSAPQQATAVVAASRGHRDLAFQQLSSAAALLVLVAIPALVGVAALSGSGMVDLVLGRFEAILMAGAALAAKAVMSESESNGTEGAMLLAGYALFAVLVWFI